MAELNEQRLNQLNARAQEIITDFARGLGSVFSDLFNQASIESTTFTENLNQNLNKTKDVTDNIKENQHKINTYLMSSGQIEGQILKLVREREDKVFKIMSNENMGQARKEHHIKKVRDGYKENLEKLQDQLDEVMNQEAGVNAIGKAIHKLNKIPFIGGLLNTSMAMRAFNLQLKITGNVTKALTVAFKVMGKALIAALPLAFLGAVVASMVMVSKQAAEAGRQLGIAAKEALQMRQDFAQAANSSNDLRVSATEMLKTQGAINKIRGTGQRIEEATLMAITSTVDAKLMSIEAATNLLRLSNLTGKSFAENELLQVGAVKAIERERGMRLDIGGIMDKANKTTGQIRANIGANPEELAKMAALAHSFGMELEQIKSISSGLLNFESSISAELEAELLLGKQLNLEKARLAALTGDYDTLMREVNANVGDFYSFSKLNVLQQDALAASLGMSSGQLSDMLFKQADLESMKAKARAENDQETLENLKQLDLQEKFNKAMIRLKEIFVESIAPALEDFTVFLLKGEKTAEKIKTIFNVGIGGGIVYAGIQLLKFANYLRTTIGVMALLKLQAIGTAIANAFSAAMSSPASFLTGGIAGLALGAILTAAIMTAVRSAKDDVALGPVGPAGYSRILFDGGEGMALNDNDFISSISPGSNQGAGGGGGTTNETTSILKSIEQRLSERQTINVTNTTSRFDEGDPEYGDIKKDMMNNSVIEQSPRGA